MFIKRLELHNYRCFPSLDLDFERDLTVFVAPNGGGKTAVLEAIATALSPLTKTMGEPSEFDRFKKGDTRRVLSPDNKMEPVSSPVYGAEASLSGSKIGWTSLALSPKGEVWVKALIKNHEEWVTKKTAEPKPFPLISYYGTGRLWNLGRLSKRKKTEEIAPNARYRGYTDCLSASSHYKAFVDWFRRFSYEAKRNPGESDSPHLPERPLSVVQKAVDTALAPSGCGWHGLQWDFAEDTIVAQHPDYGRLPVDSLSDGIRNMIGLVADIAHRAARLNPQFGAEAAEKTAGIVLIDEVDMHLHPSWQQVVLRSLREAFPCVQFIVTTHSPQVLTTLPKRNIRTLVCDSEGNWTASIPPISPLAHESGDALAYIMETQPQPNLGLLDDIHRYEQLVRSGQGNTEDAHKVLEKLNNEGFEFSAAEQTMFHFLARKQSLPESETHD